MEVVNWPSCCGIVILHDFTPWLAEQLSPAKAKSTINRIKRLPNKKVKVLAIDSQQNYLMSEDLTKLGFNQVLVTPSREPGSDKTIHVWILDPLVKRKAKL